MNKRFLRNVVAYLVGGLGLLLIVSASYPNAISAWFAGGDKGVGFALRGGLVGIPLFCTAVILFFLKIDSGEVAEGDAPAPAAEGDRQPEGGA